MKCACVRSANIKYEMSVQLAHSVGRRNTPSVHWPYAVWKRIEFVSISTGREISALFLSKKIISMEQCTVVMKSTQYENPKSAIKL